MKGGKPNKLLLGRVSCDQIVPYPPGIPVLVPAQIIDEAVLDYLAKLIVSDTNFEIHGLIKMGGEYALRVLTPEEAAEL